MENPKTLKLLNRVIDFYEKKIKYLMSNPSEQSKLLDAQAMKDYFEAIRTAHQEKKPIAWTSFAVPSELFYAMDMTPFLVEQFCIGDIVRSISEGEGYEFFDIAFGTGFANEICSPHRASIGMMRSGLLPPPDMVVCSEAPCDSGLVSFNNYAYFYKSPSFFFDYPYNEDEVAIQYYKRQLQDLIRFLEEQTGRKMDQDRLREVIQISKKAFDYYGDCLELRQSVPSPCGGRVAFNLAMMLGYNAGTPRALRYMEAFYQENKARVERKEGVIPIERHRIAWWGGYPFYDFKLVDWCEQQFQAVVVAEGQSLTNSRRPEDTSDPLRWLARRSHGWGIWRICLAVSRDILGELRENSQKLKIDGAVHFAHLGCKLGGGSIRLFRDTWQQEVGIPVLTLDGDLLDPRIVSINQMKSKLREFFAMMEQQTSK